MLSKGGGFMKNDKYVRYFCENIKAIRKANKLTKGKMAQKLGVDKNDLSNLEKGKVPDELSVDVLTKIYKYFGIKATKMFSPNCMEDD